MRDLDERVARRVREHEVGLFRFLTPHARQLYGASEQDPEVLRDRKDLSGRIGWDDFNTRFQVPFTLERWLRGLRAPDACYVMAWLPGFGGPHPLDRQIVPREKAMANLYEVTAAIISFVPGELVLVQEDPLHGPWYRVGLFRRHPRN